MAKITITIEDGKLGDLKGMTVGIDGEPEDPKKETVAQSIGMLLVQSIPALLSDAGAKSVCVRDLRKSKIQPKASEGLNR